MLEDREKDKRCKSIVDLGGVSRSLNSPLSPRHASGMIYQVRASFQSKQKNSTFACLSVLEEVIFLFPFRKAFYRNTVEVLQQMNFWYQK